MVAPGVNWIVAESTERELLVNSNWNRVSSTAGPPKVPSK
jgi:hypothetical protein